MNFIEKIIRFFLRSLRSILNLRINIIVFFYQLIFKKLKLGKNIKFNGTPFIRAFGQTILGNNLIFNSKTQYNTVGLFKKCTIYVAENAILKIGNYSGFSGVSIHCQQAITIGEYCKFGGNVCIWDTDFHSLNYKERQNINDTDIQNKPIIIENNVFIGANTIVLKGVIIGENSIIGAGSVVTKSVPSNEIWAGNPIQFIRKIHQQ